MRNFKHLGLISLLSLNALSSAVIAQTAPPPAMETVSAEQILEEKKAFYQDWYQIEVIVFERRYQANSSEVWPKNIFLAYPYQIKILQTEEEWELAKKVEEGLIEFDEYGNPIEPSLDEQTRKSTALPQQQNPNNSDLDTLDFATTTDHESDENHAELNPDEAGLDEAEIEIPFLKLAAEHKILNSEASRLSNNNQYRVLFHEAWRQPLESSKPADAILITGGDRYGDHFELEGNIELSVNRFLHIKTNLWLSQFEANYGQESEHWPALPNIPTNTPKEESELAIDDNSTFSLGTSSQEKLSPSSFKLNDQDNANSIFSQGFEFKSNEPVYDSAFLQKEVILVQQGRKMRSTELHHLDHPRLGLLIKIVKHAPFEETN